MHLGHTYSASGHRHHFFLFFFFIQIVFRLFPLLLFAGDKNKNEGERNAGFGASTANTSSNFMHPPRYSATRAKRGD